MMGNVSRTHADPFLRRLMLLLTILIVLGVAGTVAAVIGAKEARSASAADVNRNAELIRRLTVLERASSDNVEDHRTRNEIIHADICRLLYEVIQAAPSLRDAGIAPCSPIEIPERRGG